MKDSLHSSVDVLTGNIGSGKSLFCEILEDLGAKIISADKVAREVVKPGEKAFLEIVKTFGENVLSGDGSINRQHLGKIIFSDESARKKLEAITHPEIAKSVRKQFATLRAKHPEAVLIYECPLFFEANPNSEIFRNTILISADPKIRAERLKKRDSLSHVEIDNRIKSQIADSEKIHSVDFHILNNGDTASLKEKAIKLYQELKIGGNSEK